MPPKFFCSNDSLMTILKCVKFPILITLENTNANVMVNNQNHKFLSKGRSKGYRKNIEYR